MSLTAIDLFAGLGGSSHGARLAGCKVKWAANHWKAACDFHRLNHPDVEVVCQDLRQFDYSRAPRHDLLLASPECRGHTIARGKERKHHDESRSTAWAVIDCAECHLPSIIITENVPEFLRWQLYPAWEMALHRLGYSLAPFIIDAADHGVPQNRKRVYVVGTRTKNPITLRLPKRDHVPASSFIDWSLPTSPIRRRGRSRKTLKRIAASRPVFGDRFLLPYYSSAIRGRSLDRPLGTVTTRDRFGLIDGDRMRMLNVHENRAAMGFPATYILPENEDLAVHLLGNAVCPEVERDLIEAVLTA